VRSYFKVQQSFYSATGTGLGGSNVLVHFAPDGPNESAKALGWVFSTNPDTGGRQYRNAVLNGLNVLGSFALWRAYDENNVLQLELNPIVLIRQFAFIEDYPGHPRD
jgi:hypothetical protein